MNSRVLKALDAMKEQVNAEYGISHGIPAINHGPCGVFAQIFFQSWNQRFEHKVHIVFVMTRSGDECDHVLIRLSTGELYDGGIGVHTDHHYLPSFRIEEMLHYDEALLDRRSYGLNRTYPRYCPNFDRRVVESIVQSTLDSLLRDLSEDHATL